MYPADILERFRVLGLERVGRIETTWNRLVQLRSDDAGFVREMMRELHTIKGDASVIGWREVRELCAKLEDLLEVCEDTGFEISEDVELVITMALQLVTMLLRVKPGMTAGLDLPGFVRQVDDVLRETRTLPRPSRRPAVTRHVADAVADRISEDTRHALASAATSVFIEYLSARGAISRNRLRDAWTSLRDSIARSQDVAIAPQLARHVAAGQQLADELGKRVEMRLVAEDVRLEARIAEAIDVAVLHIVRNAIDHGIEAPGDRGDKPARAIVTTSAKQHGDELVISVSDDGRGIDLAGLRAKLAPDRDVPDDELIFEPGLSTKNHATDVSGRGVGMDAVKAAIERVDGTIAVTTSPAGTAISISVRVAVRELPAYRFLAPGGMVALAVSARWAPTVETVPAHDSIDPLRAIQMFGRTRQTDPGGHRLLRELSIRLRWGFLETSLRAASEPELVTGIRGCATRDDDPLEVITVNGIDTLLLRPAHIGEIAAGWSARTRTATRIRSLP